jgi:hypothetical protein
LGENERALTYATAALETDLTISGTVLPMVRTVAFSIQGRALAALGRTSEAAASFEASAELAQQYGLYLLQAFAYRDLKLLILDRLVGEQSEQGKQCSRQLGHVLRRLKGPAETLTPMLDGLDAAALMCLPPPDPSFQMAYTPEEDLATGALRRELAGLRLKGLRDRAKQLGVDDDTLEDALDAEDSKSAVIALILAANEAAEDVGSQSAQQEAALRTELKGLRLKALRKRARDAGIDSASIEDTTDRQENGTF